MLVQAVALTGRLEVLQHLLADQHCPRPNDVSHYAARSGSISMLKWLKTQSWCEFDGFTCTGAVRARHLAALEYLLSEGCQWNKVYISSEAASSGSIEVVECLRQQQGVEFNEGALIVAAGAGHTAMCAYLRSIGCDWDVDACTAAAYGRLETLCWLRANGCPWIVSDAFIGAARNGSTDILDYVIQQGEVLSAELLTEALNAAGMYNKLQAAQWLRQHGAEWPAVLGYNEEDHVERWSGESLAWARANGCTAPIPPPSEYDHYD
eukprot:11147-Heterococcus_DN1.PRE.3